MAFTTIQLLGYLLMRLGMKIAGIHEADVRRNFCRPAMLNGQAAVCQGFVTMVVRP
jgi:hypothetical protein